MTDDVPVSTEIQVDDETRAALLLFNERVEATAAEERAAKRIAKAERAKDEAAAAVRKTNDNANASAEEKAAAEASYKEAVDSLQAIKADPTVGLDKPKAKAAPAAAEETAPAATEDTGPDESSAAEETAPAEVSADEESAPASEASAESE